MKNEKKKVNDSTEAEVSTEIPFSARYHLSLPSKLTAQECSLTATDFSDCHWISIMRTGQYFSFLMNANKISECFSMTRLLS